MIDLWSDEGIESLPDGSLITWLRIEGDETSRAVAFVRAQYEPTGDVPPYSTQRVTWISPGGWSPMSIRHAEVSYPAHVISLGDIDLGDATHNDPVNEVGAAVGPDPEQLTPPDGYTCEMPSPSEYNRALTSYTLESGGTWAREKALECAARVFAGTGYGAPAKHVLDKAEEFEQWLDRPTEDETAPTLGAMAKVLTRWREAGVTLESLYYVIRAQVWHDLHTGEDELSTLDRLRRLGDDLRWAANTTTLEYPVRYANVAHLIRAIEAGGMA